jgi:hypothetical protein
VQVAYIGRVNDNAGGHAEQQEASGASRE